jgi:gluconolactonase
LAYPLNADGSPGTSSNFGPGGIDGMGLDCAGNVYLSSHGAGEVLVISPAGMQIGSVSIGASGVTNVAFGGADRTTLYITRLDSSEPGLYEVNVGSVGLPY